MPEATFVGPTPPFRWRDPQGSSWLVSFEWALIAGRLECVGVNLRPAESPDEQTGPETVRTRSTAPLTTSVLRGFPLGELVNRERRKLRRELDRWINTPKPEDYIPSPLKAAFHSPERRARRDRFIRELRTRQVRQGAEAAEKGPGRPPLYGEDHYAEVARVYRGAWESGDPHPTAAVISWAKSNRKNASSSAVRKWIARARAFGFLGETSRGKAGGVEPRRKGGAR